LAWIDCALEAEHPTGDHPIAVCRVLNLAAHHGSPLLYFQSQLRRIQETRVFRRRVHAVADVKANEEAAAVTSVYRAARDQLLSLRNDYADAVAGFE